MINNQTTSPRKWCTNITCRLLFDHVVRILLPCGMHFLNHRKPPFIIFKGTKCKNKPHFVNLSFCVALLETQLIEYVGPHSHLVFSDYCWQCWGGGGLVILALGRGEAYTCVGSNSGVTDPIYLWDTWCTLSAAGVSLIIIKTCGSCAMALNNLILAFRPRLC